MNSASNFQVLHELVVKMQRVVFKFSPAIWGQDFLKIEVRRKKQKFPGKAKVTETNNQDQTDPFH